jgi:alpha-glucosidase (family GH31 glycosyl hydrolase)
VQADLFLRLDHSDEYYEGYVWPGPVHFIDFLAPQTLQYWSRLISEFRQTVQIAGLWLDMSEPASLHTGHKDIIPSAPPDGHYSLNYPPFAINNADSQLDIFVKTINMDALHVDGTRHIALHNVYGLSESYCTARALEQLDPGKRHFLLTRSTFPGSGRFTAHWLGDNFSDFHHMRLSISGLFDFQLFGIPMVGADICGFLGTSDMELCARWMALGAFYPFARNHNAERPEYVPQEPYRWPEVAKVTRKYFGFRYSILSYWYTLQRMAHEGGRPMIRPLFFEYPHLTALYDNDEYFMVGSALLIAPVLTRGAKAVKFDLPPGVWYDALEMDASPLTVKTLQTVQLYADLMTIPVLLRGGNLMLRQKPELTVRDTLKNDYELLVGLDLNGEANGMVYFDDGISSNPGHGYSKVNFKVQCGDTGCSIKIFGTFNYKITQFITSMTILSPHVWTGNAQTIILDDEYSTPCTFATTGYKIHLTKVFLELNNPQELFISIQP